ncbi:MAG: hypothetical protein V4660_13145 [Pseudomonadota bacterium]
MLPDPFKQSLAIVADTYNPILLLISLFICVQIWKQGYPLYIIRLAGAAFAVYSIMFMDLWLGIWQYAGLDYSTHTATSLAMIIFISQNKSIKIKIALGVSLLIYGAIMKFLNYHTWGDMITTGMVIALMVNLVDKIIVKFLPSRYRNELSPRS